MTFCNFETSTHGKWILTGEHAVLRGHGALVFPIKDKRLTLKFNVSDSDLSADYDGESGADLHLLFWSVLEHGMHLLQQSINRLNGHFHITCNIPLGVGIGASAALCVATARWFAAQGLILQNSIFDFAQRLENLFHGESSGLDIAGVNAETGIYFNQKKFQPIQQVWSPHWYLSSCEQIGITSHCIHQVQTMWEKDPIKASAIDKKMDQSVELAHQALTSDAPDMIDLLATAINQSRDCFQSWHLVSDSLNLHMQKLLDAGAIAVKPTGSGGGGHVISLWETPPTIGHPNLIKL